MTAEIITIPVLNNSQISILHPEYLSFKNNLTSSLVENIDKLYKIISCTVTKAPSRVKSLKSRVSAQKIL